MSKLQEIASLIGAIFVKWILALHKKLHYNKTVTLDIISVNEYPVAKLSRRV